MNTERGNGLEVLTYARYLEVIAQCQILDKGMDIKREDQRKHASGVATVQMTDSEGNPCRFLAHLVQLSGKGCMLRTDRELAIETPVTIEFALSDGPCLIQGRVRHSTGTVGGFKTGVELSFADTEA